MTDTSVRSLLPGEEELFYGLEERGESDTEDAGRFRPPLAASEKPSRLYVLEVGGDPLAGVSVSTYGESSFLLEPPRWTVGAVPEEVVPALIKGVVQDLKEHDAVDVSTAVGTGASEEMRRVCVKAFEGAGLNRFRGLDVYQRDLSGYRSRELAHTLIFRSMAMAGEEPFIRLLGQIHEGSLESLDEDPYEAFERFASSRPFTPNTWLMAFDLSTPVGMVLVQVDEDARTGSLLYLGVVPAFRGKGLGRLLHRKGLAILRKHLVTEYVAFADKKNEPMARILEKDGCSKVDFQEVYRIRFRKAERRPAAERPAPREPSRPRESSPYRESYPPRESSRLSQDQKEALSRFMSYILRHHPDEFGLTMDEEGYVSFPDFLHSVARQRKWRFLTKEAVEQLVNGEEAERFEIQNNKIRCRYGHSMKTRIQYPEIDPTGDFYFGTTRKTVSKILEEGLLPIGRQYVHLSNSVEEARAVGSRHEKDPVILVIRGTAAHEDGIRFYRATESITLANEIPPDFIERLD